MAPSMVKTSASGRKYTAPGKVLSQRHLLTVQISLNGGGGWTVGTVPKEYVCLCALLIMSLLKKYLKWKHKMIWRCNSKKCMWGMAGVVVTS